MARVVAGAIAKIVLKDVGVDIRAFVSQVADVVIGRDYRELDLSLTESNMIRCPDPESAERMIRKIRGGRGPP